MITVAPLKESEKITAFFKKAGIGVPENAGCVVASVGEEVLGFCLYDLTDKGITVLYIEPKDDLSLADGILRSTLHVAASRSAMDARYEGEENEKLFSKLGFILDKADKKLDIDKLFRGC
ncbi:MAG: hypothetical protein J5662_03260, partial [Clostridia bacterium]|nr:hypothetical protein [Clostridia bacterium]